MTVGLGAWLAAAAGALSGVVEVRLRPEPQRGSALLGAVAGGIIGVLAYGAFLVAGLVIGLLTWSTAPEPWPTMWLGGVGLARHSRRGKSIGLVLACAGLTVAGAWSVIGRVP